MPESDQTYPRLAQNKEEVMMTHITSLLFHRIFSRGVSASLSEFLDGDDALLDAALVEQFAQRVDGAVVVPHCLQNQGVLQLNCDLLF